MTYRDRYDMMLRAMPGTLNEIAYRTGVPKSTVKKWTMDLRNMGWAHVSRWKRSDGPGRMQPVIKAGPGRNVPCTLPVLTKTECQRNCRIKIMKADPDRHDVHLARRRARWSAAKIVASGRKATPFDALLGGLP